jgi:hypothetical protein
MHRLRFATCGRQCPTSSDCRNLNGGVGSTFWIKRTDIDSNGWVAVA